MSEAKHNVWNVLALALGACTFICLGVWIYLLSTICWSPVVLNPITGNVFAYNCHGSIVFISQTQRVLRFESYDDQAGFDSAILACYVRLGTGFGAGPCLARD